MASEGLVTSLLGAVQASIAVLLTIFYGVLAAQFGLVSGESAKDLSKLSIRMFLPALLITKVGKELHADTALRYGGILIWALAYIFISMAFGALITRIFKLPKWVTPAICFNNTTSLPLLLVQSLDATGILSKLVISDDDSTSDAIERAKSYFLVAAIVSNSLTTALGPKLMEDDEPDDDGDQNADEANGEDNRDVEEGQAVENAQEEVEGDGIHETTSLLPDGFNRREHEAEDRAFKKGKTYWDRLSPRAKNSLDTAYAFCNAPIVGAIIGVILGLTPGLHKAFFGDPQDGGFFNAWLTSSVKNIGDLFVSLQVVVVGIKLSSSLRKFKRGEDSGDVPWISAVFVLITRFVIWPVISISIIWAVASKTNWLSDDPMLWFVLMMIPTGPSAMNLVATADVYGCKDSDKLAIAKFLTISYVVSPLICFTVVMSLRASESAIGSPK